jgi:hypothetical protein
MGLAGYDIEQFNPQSTILDEWYSANITGPQQLQVQHFDIRRRLRDGYRLQLCQRRLHAALAVGGISVSPALTAGMKTAIQPTNFSAPNGSKMGFVGWVVTPKGIVYKDGGHPGFSTWVGLVPVSQIGLLILLNTGGNPVTEAGLLILKSLLDGN